MNAEVFAKRWNIEIRISVPGSKPRLQIRESLEQAKIILNVITMATYQIRRKGLYFTAFADYLKLYAREPLFLSGWFMESS